MNNIDNVQQTLKEKHEIYFMPVVASRRLLVCLHREVKGAAAVACC